MAIEVGNVIEEQDGKINDFPNVINSIARNLERIVSRWESFQNKSCCHYPPKKDCDSCVDRIERYVQRNYMQIPYLLFGFDAMVEMMHVNVSRMVEERNKRLEAEFMSLSKEQVAALCEIYKMPVPQRVLNASSIITKHALLFTNHQYGMEALTVLVNPEIESTAYAKKIIECIGKVVQKENGKLNG